ncbi:MAG: ParB/RepB/Spo0J family partition protein [Actinomycetota bacterium]|nr:ParB/RepB/Spo0J family partition protein [Actinomycetota bacterium]
MANKRGLGKGLNSLIPAAQEGQERGDSSILNSSILKEIPIKAVEPNPNQPRKKFDPKAFEELVSSVKQFGVLQPVMVRTKGLGFELIAGERRLRAAADAGLEAIPAIVKDSSDIESLELALIENIQRENLSPIEEAEGFKELIEKFGLTQGDLSAIVGKSRVAVTNSLRLLQLPAEVRTMLEKNEISSGHARALLSLDDEERQIELARRILEEGMSVRQTESTVKMSSLSSSRQAAGPKPLQPKAFRTMARSLSEKLSAKVRIKMTEKKGKIEIDFKSLNDLERIFRTVMGSSSFDQDLEEAE